MMKSYKNITDSKIDWLGEVPNEWKVVKLKYALADVPYPIVDGPFGTQLKADEYTDSGVPLVRISNLDFKGNLTLEDIKFISEQKALEIQRSRIKLNDIIIGKTGATIGKSGLNDKIEYGIVSSSCLKISVDENKLLPLFFRYYVTSANFQNIILQTASGSTRDTINITPMANIEVVIPTLEEQIKIVQYLDHQTTIIDQLIQQKEKLIELLKEKRQAVINEAVTKGLNPNAKMKNSGIEWLGEIPETYRLLKIKSLLMSGKILQQDGNHGELHPTADDYVDEGVPFIMANNVNEGSVDLINCKFLPLKITEKLRIGFSKEGDVLITHKGTVGRVAIVPKINTRYIMLTPQVTYYRVLDKDISNEYLALIFQSDFFQIQLKIMGSEGSTRSYVGLLNQKDLKLILPDYSTQIQILSSITEKLNGFDGTINFIKIQIEKLKEYRQSIISEAVTGKIDVRDWQVN
jgi:type I restriction enzyme S subunit